MAETFFDINLALLEQLQEPVQWTAQKWMKDCFDLNKLFHVVCVFRSQAAQYLIYTKGRTKEDMLLDYAKGKISNADREALFNIYNLGHNDPDPIKRTWTTHSLHTQGLAVDILPINCTHADIAPIAQKYGITHPFPQEDPAHYEFDKAPKNADISINGLEAMKALRQQIDLTYGATKGRYILRYNKYAPLYSLPLYIP